MTNELEKTFFDTFGIEPKTIIEPRYSLNTEYYEKKVAYYPQITDSILLELICILAKQGIYLEDIDGLLKMKTYETRIVMQNADNLKDVILKTAKAACRLSKDDNFKQQVRILFEEE